MKYRTLIYDLVGNILDDRVHVTYSDALVYVIANDEMYHRILEDTSRIKRTDTRDSWDSWKVIESRMPENFVDRYAK